LAFFAFVAFFALWCFAFVAFLGLAFVALWGFATVAVGGVTLAGTGSVAVGGVANAMRTGVAGRGVDDEDLGGVRPSAMAGSAKPRLVARTAQIRRRRRDTGNSIRGRGRSM
jgi:hypothetical protein